MESVLALPSFTNTVLGMASFPSSTTALLPPVWVIESVANELLSTVAVRMAFTGDVMVSERTKLPLSSTLFAAKVKLAPVAVTVTFLTVVGMVLPCPDRVTKSKLVVPGRVTVIDVTALEVVNGVLPWSIVLPGTTPTPGTTGVALERPSPCHWRFP